MSMNLDWLKGFEAPAAHGNFPRAADARHVAQPAFTSHLAGDASRHGARQARSGSDGA